MHIHADRRKVEADGHREVGGLAPDAGQFAQLLYRIRQDTAKPLLQHLRQSLQMAGLVAIESNRIDELFDFSHHQTLKVFRTEHIPLCGGEQPSHSPGGALILRTGGKDRTDKDAERIVGLSLNEFDDRG